MIGNRRSVSEPEADQGQESQTDAVTRGQASGDEGYLMNFAGAGPEETLVISE